ncbi:MAG TPA: hypothetical protein VJ829_02110, partial [Candidatus Binatia bacterium]|nr:hypothetical protein [Candidatus Binatia bacterium]
EPHEVEDCCGLGLLLASPAVDPALAACVNQKCPDAALVATARAEVESRCGCLREGQTHKKYTTCVKKLMKAADLTALVPNKKCRQLIVLLL